LFLAFAGEPEVIMGVGLVRKNDRLECDQRLSRKMRIKVATAVGTRDRIYLLVSRSRLSSKKSFKISATKKSATTYKRSTHSESFPHANLKV
jgi:hypothetical protein